MKNLWNKFGVSKRSEGHIDENGNVVIDKILSYDVVDNPGFSNARIDWSDINDLLKRIQEMLKREELLKSRKEKLEKLNNL